MSRRLAITLGASAIIGAGALAAAAASAKSSKHHWNGRGGIYMSHNTDAVDADCYLVRKEVWKPDRKHVHDIRPCS